eukprot:scaffold2002_cov328-Prasinococcus_capsulatus_cf.AAC.1
MQRFRAPVGGGSPRRRAGRKGVKAVAQGAVGIAPGPEGADFVARARGAAGALAGVVVHVAHDARQRLRGEGGPADLRGALPVR